MHNPLGEYDRRRSSLNSRANDHLVIQSANTHACALLDPRGHPVSGYLVKSASHSLVQAVGNVGGAQNQHTGSRGGHPLHLHQELSLDAARCLAFPLSSGTTQGINLHRQSMLCCNDI